MSIVAFFYIHYREVRVPFEVPSKSNLIYIGVGILVTLITALGLLQLQSMLDLMSKSIIQEVVENNPIILIVLAILSVVLVAPSEELLFRGAVQGRLRENFGPYASILTASLLFGSLHLLNFTGSILPTLMSAFIIVIIGGILGWLYEKTENLAVPILVHAMYNFILLVPSYFTMV
ncbi:MAG: CPBP family intramembrane glutamic endopeptidase [Thermoplasmatota archaeon]